MKKVMVFAGVILVWALIAVGSSAAKTSDLLVDDICSLNRSFFPPGFIFGTAGSSYQYEGAANEGGRAPSIWDTFTHEYPEKIADGSNGDVAVDQYHRYKEDIEIAKSMNLDAYRFSISWSRLLPKGISGGINQEGVDYYNNFIDELLSKGLKPFATIFHWDVPQALEDEYGGFLSSNIRKDFGEYAEVCFNLFGDRVKHWITINEPHVFSEYGYATGMMAPGRCSDWQNLNCTGGDSSTEPYIVAHNLLLSHATAVQIYRSMFQASQEGTIGITMNGQWYVPLTDSQADQEAASRAFDFQLGWFMRPLVYGEYPKSMQSLVGSRLPEFSSEECELIEGSFDFVGINYYTANYASDATNSTTEGHKSYLTDAHVTYSTERDGRPIGPTAGSSWLHIYPRGFREVLRRVKDDYKDPLIYITENGMDEFNDASLPLDESLLDSYRIDFFFRHLYYLRSAIYDYGVNVKGYFAWSLLDNFEWFNGYTVRFGTNFVDYANDLQRHPKLSALWFKNILKKEEGPLLSSI